MSDSPQYLIEPLDAARHLREQFACESPELTDFLQKQARKEMAARASAGFVLVAASDPGRTRCRAGGFASEVTLHPMARIFVCNNG